MKLTAARRKRLPRSDFADPASRSKSGGEGGYPIPDKGHAKAALGRVAANGSPAQKKKVRKAVKRKFPSMKVNPKYNITKTPGY